jgi:capsular polysaccharide biosynthesis protein
MIKRIFNKGMWYVNLAIGKTYLFLEQKRIVKPVPSSYYKHVKNGIPVDHKYPINFEETDKALFAHYTGYTTFDEQVYLLHDVNVNISGVVFRGLKNFAESLPHTIFRCKYSQLYLAGQYSFSKKVNAPTNKRYVLLHDFWSIGNYYHWIVDTLPRLKIVLEELKRENYSLILPEKRPKFIDAILKYYEIAHVTSIKENEYLAVHELLVPYYLAGPGHIHPESVREIKRHFLSKINSTVKKERIYVSRSRQKARRVINEAEVAALLTDYGFETVYWEDHSFEEQVQISQNAKFMVSSHGANLTNLMFMKEGSSVLEIIKEVNPNFCYWALASVTGVNYFYQLTKMPQADHLLVDIDLLKRNMERMLNG